jgi:hypothetical protein
LTQSITAIANRALQLVGATSIVNLADNTPEAREVSRAYDACRRAELRAHTWSFAIARAVLAADTEPPTFGARYSYALPADCLRVLVDRTTPNDWQVIGRSITTDQPAPLPVRYVVDITDATQFDALFCEVLACGIALAIVEPLTQSNQKKQSIKDDHRAALAAARHANAMEVRPQEAPDSAWITARQSPSRALPGCL